MKTAYKSGLAAGSPRKELGIPGGKQVYEFPEKKLYRCFTKPKIITQEYFARINSMPKTFWMLAESGVGHELTTKIQVPIETLLWNRTTQVRV